LQILFLLPKLELGTTDCFVAFFVLGFQLFELCRRNHEKEIHRFYRSARCLVRYNRMRAIRIPPGNNADSFA